jgi:hypothetical protein
VDLAAISAGTSQLAAELPTAQAQRPGLSTAILRPLEDTLNPAVRLASGRAPSAATPRADRQGAIHHAEAPAWVAEQCVAAGAEADLAAVGADIGNRSFAMFLGDCEI